jgi:hypothetical protein
MEAPLLSALALRAGTSSPGGGEAGGGEAGRGGKHSDRDLPA